LRGQTTATAVELLLNSEDADAKRARTASANLARELAVNGQR